MVSPEQMAGAYGRNTEIVKMQADGLSYAESLAQLPFRGNGMNWLVGHILTGRNNVLKLLGVEPALEESRRALQALSVFPLKPNSFSEEAALAVSGAAIERLDTLVDYGAAGM